jgi:hypothetical protein
VQREDERWPRLLAEVKSWAMLPRIFAFSRTSGRESGRPSVRGSIRLAVQEVVLDELEVGVEAEGLVVDVAPLRVGADHERRHAQPVALAVDRGGLTWS